MPIRRHQMENAINNRFVISRLCTVAMGGSNSSLSRLLAIALPLAIRDHTGHLPAESRASSTVTTALFVTLFALMTSGCRHRVPISSFPDAPVIPPSIPVPDQGSVGTLPGVPSVEGGAATYRIPIEVPPGRMGMQPDISLAYSSRNGNGILGVGWTLAGLSTIYRCPRTLSQDGANRPVQHDQKDRFCMDGQRLVGPSDLAYGTADTEYRTELDQFDRITLRGGNSSWSSSFTVEHKSGRISQYEPGDPLGSPNEPDVWYLVREFDRHGNCIAYN